MTVSDILNELSKRGIEIELAGEKIKLHGSSKYDFDESLVELIKAHKSEIIATLNPDVCKDLKSRPNWCIECQYCGYKTEDTGSQILWCGLANQAVLEMQKCIKQYWTKNEKGFPITVH